MWIVLAALSAVSYGAADFCGALATRRSRVLSVLVVSQLCGLVLVAVAAPVVGPRGPALADLAWGAAAGVVGVSGLAVFYRALATTLISVVSPVAAVVGAALPVLFGLALGERPAAGGWIGLPLGVAAILALSMQGVRGADRRRVLSALGLGLGAGIGFAGFFILVARTSESSGLWPLLAARTATVTLMLGLSLLLRRAPELPRGSRAVAVLAGVLDMAANLLYLLAARYGLVSLAAVVVSLYAAPTVVLARIFLGERLGALRVGGVVLAIAAVAVMSIS